MNASVTAVALLCSLLISTSAVIGSLPPEEEAPGPLDWAEPSPEWVTALPQAEETDQLFIVAAVSKTRGEASMHQRDEKGVWRQLMTTNALLGRNGLGKTREGDGKTPAGVFRFNCAFGVAADPGCAIPYRQVTGDDWWSGDQREGYGYNRMVSIAALPDLNRAASEHIIDNTVPYQYCLNISYNESGIPGLGSAIFLHCPDRKNGPTAGCVTIPADRMLFVMQHVLPQCTVIIEKQADIIAAGKE